MAARRAVQNIRPHGVGHGVRSRRVRTGCQRESPIGALHTFCTALQQLRDQLRRLTWSLPALRGLWRRRSVETRAGH